MGYPSYSGLEGRKRGLKKFTKIAKVATFGPAGLLMNKRGLKQVKKVARYTPAGAILGEYDYEDSGLGKFKMPKAFRKVGALVAGATGGVIGIKPKALGVKSHSGRQMFRVGRVVGGVALVGAMAATGVLNGVGASVAKAGHATLGGLKFVGGKLMSAPSAVMDLFKSKGIDPATATPEQAVQAGIETGTITTGMLEQLGGIIPSVGQALQALKPQVEYPGGANYPAAPGTGGGGGVYSEGGGGGLMDTLGPMLPWIGVGIVAIVLVPILMTRR